MIPSSVLTTLAHALAPFPSTFLVTHLSVPTTTNSGGSGLSYSVMYTASREGVLPNHIQRMTPCPALSTLRRPRLSTSDVDTTLQSEKPLIPKPRARIRKRIGPLSVSTYTTLFLFVPTHTVTHCLLPTKVDAFAWSSSIVNLDTPGSSEFEFKFVKTAIKT
ncbi:hypothetical protein EDD16DRAFT_1711383 [Pisolithus croceorrhizus]|nr:hypothetical protein EV401DRAFT_2082653 [Pisolithus croceorrhizus]KAI6109325.1 hypothetical protein EDD16DRAFT_1711383 [Pisolithus croceorrhizus]KAI6147569.1 hypothetical protein EDD17DRAFT_1767184 [Pisolithus thermaeus]